MREDSDPDAVAANLILGFAPPEKAGSAAAISETGGELGVALGIATLGSVATAVYHDQTVEVSDGHAIVVPAGMAHRFGLANLDHQEDQN